MTFLANASHGEATHSNTPATAFLEPLRGVKTVTAKMGEARLEVRDQEFERPRAPLRGGLTVTLPAP